MRWTKLTGLKVDFESDITSSTVTYPLPVRGGQINQELANNGTGNQDNALIKGGQNEVVRTKAMRQEA